MLCSKLLQACKTVYNDYTGHSRQSTPQPGQVDCLLVVTLQDKYGNLLLNLDRWIILSLSLYRTITAIYHCLVSIAIKKNYDNPEGELANILYGTD